MHLTLCRTVKIPIKINHCMTVNRRLKIWTLITHALIIVGMGHGIACFAIVEIISFRIFFLFYNIHSTDPSDILLMIVGLAALLGQCAIAFSLLTRRNNLKIPFYIIGLIFLWASVICFQYITSIDHYTHLLTITCLPFLVCSVIFFLGQPIKRLYYYILDI